MPVSIGGTTGIGGNDGTVGTPAVRGSANNTGIYFPSAGNVAIAINGVQKVLIDNTGALTVGGASISPVGSMNVFTSNGTFTIPTGVTTVKVTVVGGGGGGGGNIANYASQASAGGGGGGTAIKIFTGLTPGLTLNVTVGNGGAGGTAANGSNAQTSNVYSGTQTITTVSATGGDRGLAFLSIGNYPMPFGGAGGIGSGGDLNIRGHAGGYGQTQGDYVTYSPGAVSGFGGGTTHGGGGASVSGATFNGNAGGSYGGGGSGSGGTTASGVGGSGAAGVVIFEY